MVVKLGNGVTLFEENYADTGFSPISAGFHVRAELENVRLLSNDKRVSALEHALNVSNRG